VFVFEVFEDGLLYFLQVLVLDAGDDRRAAGEVVEDVAYLQVVQVQVAFVQLPVGLLQQVQPDLV
jgi:hypothetical protein